MKLKSSVTFWGDWLPRSVPVVPGCAYATCHVSNLECAISGERSRREKAHSLVLDESAYNVVATSMFSAISVANNHVCDAGEIEFGEMIARLREIQDIQFYGTVDKPFADLAIDGQRVAVLGCLEKCRSRGRRIFPEEGVCSLIGELKRDGYRVVVTPHWGKESELAYAPSPAQQQLARRWTELGASGVVGNHSHTVQGVQWFDGRPCFYSLGNFEFDHPLFWDRPETHLGLAVTWTPASDGWTPSFSFQHGGTACQLSEAAAATAESLFAYLSHAISDEPSAAEWLTWARRTGPIYIPVNHQSWAKRMRARPLAALAKRAVWMALPQTLLMHLGAAFPDRDYLLTIEKYHRMILQRACEQTG